MQRFDAPQVLETLVRLGTLHPDIFGAEAHGFRLNPRLSEGNALAFEEEHKTALPIEYRQFLRDVGNGGAGPFYGVFPLEQMDDNTRFRQWRENDGLVGILSEPFPLEEAWNDLTSMPNSELESEDGDEYQTQMESFEARYWSAALVNGAIPICHKGCALRIWLVVTGNQAGYLWEDQRGEHGGLHPLRLIDGTRATFAGWYKQWLDECVATVDGGQVAKS